MAKHQGAYVEVCCAMCSWKGCAASADSAFDALTDHVRFAHPDFTGTFTRADVPSPAKDEGLVD